jgi:hypothetical protein
MDAHEIDLSLPGPQMLGDMHVDRGRPGRGLCRADGALFDFDAIRRWSRAGSACASTRCTP